MSWYFHNLPEWFHQISCGMMFGIELIVPFLFLLPRRLRLIAFWVTAGLMLLIVLTRRL